MIIVYGIYIAVPLGETNPVVTWSLRIFSANATLKGIMKRTNKSPAIEEGPSCCHRKYIHRATTSGADQIRCRKGGASCSFCASTDIRLTISPTLVSRRAEVLIRRACRDIMTHLKSNCYHAQARQQHSRRGTGLKRTSTVRRIAFQNRCALSIRLLNYHYTFDFSCCKHCKHNATLTCHALKSSGCMLNYCSWLSYKSF